MHSFVEYWMQVCLNNSTPVNNAAQNRIDNGSATKLEQYWAAHAGYTDVLPNTPHCRFEEYMNYIITQQKSEVPSESRIDELLANYQEVVT